MGKLNKNSFMECFRHGNQKPVFVCCHLYNGDAKSVVESNILDPEHPFVNAWCEKCDVVLMQHGGEWDEQTEEIAGIDVKVICAGCYAEILDKIKTE